LSARHPIRATALGRGHSRLANRKPACAFGSVWLRMLTGAAACRAVSMSMPVMGLH
jgi:hypothetical protein